MNDAMRIKAIEADEVMLRAYRAWRKPRHAAGRHIRYYVKENRAAIDAAIGAVPVEDEAALSPREQEGREIMRRFMAQWDRAQLDRKG